MSKRIRWYRAYTGDIESECGRWSIGPSTTGRARSYGLWDRCLFGVHSIETTQREAKAEAQRVMDAEAGIIVPGEKITDDML